MTEPDLDDTLRDYARRWRDAQLCPPTLDELALPTVPSTRSRRSLIIAVAASVVTVALISGGAAMIGRHGGSSPAAPPAPSVVPWDPTDVTSTAATVPFTARVGAAAGTRACTAADFTVASTHTDPDSGTSGWLATYYVLRSTATQTCSVSAYGINAVLVDSAGRALPNDGPRPAGPAMFPSELAVRPGQSVAAQVRWAVYVGRASQPDRLALFTFPQQGIAPDLTLTIPLNAVTIPSRPQSPDNTSQWRAGLYPGGPQVSDRGALTTLTATMQGPSAIVNGKTVAVMVQLANDTDTPVQLAPCPEFIALLASGPKMQTTTGVRGPLNCAQAPQAIGPGSTVTFAFELHPTNLVLGEGYLEWQLVSGNSAAASARAQLTIS